MKRKLHFFGGYSYLVTIPKRWIEKNNIQREVEVEIIENEIRIKAIKSES